MLTGLTLVSPAWVILCTAVAITISKLTARTPTTKALYGVAKEVLVACTAGAIFLAMHVGRIRRIHTCGRRPRLAAVAMWIVDEALIVPSWRSPTAAASPRCSASSGTCGSSAWARGTP